MSSFSFGYLLKWTIVLYQLLLCEVNSLNRQSGPVDFLLWIMMRELQTYNLSCTKLCSLYVFELIVFPFTKKSTG